MKTLPRYAILLLIILLLVALAACSPGTPKRDMGIDALSPDGKWATYLEHSGDPPAWRLGLLDMQNKKHGVLVAELAVVPRSAFSPNGAYLIYQASGRWYLVNFLSTDPQNSNQEILAPKDDTIPDDQAAILQELLLVQFLPDGELLLMTQDSKGLKNIYTIRDLAGDINRPEIRSAQATDLRYGFPGEGAGAFNTGMDFYQLFQLFMKFAEDTPLTTQQATTCGASATTPAIIRWALVDQSYTVRILVASKSSGVNLVGTLPRLSDNVQKSLKEEEEYFESIRITVEKQVQDEAKQAGKELSPDELKQEVDVRLGSQPTIPSVILSPLKKKLLILKVRAIEDNSKPAGQGYNFYSSLYLYDLESAKEIVASEGQIPIAEYQGYMLPTFSPDGSQLLLLKFKKLQTEDHPYIYSLELLNLEIPKIDPEVLSQGIGRLPGYTFSPDGQHILYEAEEGGERRLYLVETDGESLTRVGNGRVINFCWNR